MKAEGNSAASEAVDLASLGLRPITRWVPDVHDPDFMARYREQRAILAASMTPERESEMEWWENAQSHEGWV